MKAREKEDGDFLAALGSRIAAIRKEKGVTQVELAYRCDIEKSNMRRIEAGNTNVTVLMLKRICTALEIPMNDLFVTQ
ncbi:helix-turn-helix transcriptional regulator [Mucilaginibacter sp. dw_454]|uniref:helix-turn-helix domain-containing protein n=1 Tax=Mucilaginibacter sp. dw_454 TaxID=2720079 RepID=UPI001BD41F0D|nr:helix-turn-helix transcriptional regulator [Mucilaginibacter sp. dw_454]